MIPGGWGAIPIALLLVLPIPRPSPAGPEFAPGALGGPSGTTPVANFSGALQRLVDLVAAGGGALLALVWARVALSWFSNDVAKKVQAKDRARDALVGSLIFAAALSGLAWTLAEWVLTGR